MARNRIEAPRNIPCGHYFKPYGVLHMVVFCCYMECFRIHRRCQILLFYGLLHMAILSKAIYGVLHNNKNIIHCWKNTKYSTRLIFKTQWSTPCGYYFSPYWVLNMVVFFGAIWSALRITVEVKFFCHMEVSIWLFYDAIWSTPYGIYMSKAIWSAS